MNESDVEPDCLSGWLSYLEKLHPKTIDMGLERVHRVKAALGLSPTFPVIMVGGTNGKGSVCAMLESILTCAGYKTGCYTSPHLIRYNERVRINKQEVSDEKLCRIFSQINKVRHHSLTSLTYFEFGTLAAVSLFIQADVDVAILEVGLGGRLDAVNAFDADCSILTSIDFDHMEYLGDTREKIGFEKAAIFRKDKPAICSELDLPDSVCQQVKKMGTHCYRLAKEFGFLEKNTQWDFWGPKGWRYSLPLPALRGDKQLQNASACLTALDVMHDRLPVNMHEIRQGLTEAIVPGRFQVVSTQPMIVLDVAHNPSAAAVLSENLRTTKPIGLTYAVFAMLEDKDICGVVRAVKEDIDFWLIAPIDTPRGATVDFVVNALRNVGILNEDNSIYKFLDCVSAFDFACEQVTKNDRICIFGSFYTVGAVLQHLQRLQGKQSLDISNE